MSDVSCTILLKENYDFRNENLTMKNENAHIPTY